MFFAKFRLEKKAIFRQNWLRDGILHGIFNFGLDRKIPKIPEKFGNRNFYPRALGFLVSRDLYPLDSGFFESRDFNPQDFRNFLPSEYPGDFLSRNRDFYSRIFRQKANSDIKVALSKISNSDSLGVNLRNSLRTNFSSIFLNKTNNSYNFVN